MKETRFIFAFFSLFLLSSCGRKPSSITKEEAEKKAQEVLDKYAKIIDPSSKIKSVTEDGNYFKITYEFRGVENDSYLTKDGEMFFPSLIYTNKEKQEELEKLQEKRQEEAQKRLLEEQEKAKQDELSSIPVLPTPKVELFVMSHCPYGTQMEKGILPVLDLLKEKIDFELKFVDYAMHEKKEIDEQIRQYCIQKNEKEKLVSYLYCFLEDENSERCVEKVGINKSSLAYCIKETDETYNISKLYEDKSSWKGSFPQFPIYSEENKTYKVQGSPTFVINGKKIENQGRDPNSLLQTICNGFDSKPEECNQTLSTSTPSPGFGFSEASNSNSSASCG